MTSITSSEEEDDFATVEFFFTSETFSDGAVRVYSRVFYDRRWRDKRPAVLIVPDPLADTD